MRKRLTVAGAVLVVLVVAIGGSSGGAAATGPRSSRRWRTPRPTRSGFLDRLGRGPRPERARSRRDLVRQRAAKFLTRAYDADLTSASALVESAPVLQTLRLLARQRHWELFSQGRPARSSSSSCPTTRLDAIADRLRDTASSSPRTPAACGTASRPSSEDRLGPDPRAAVRRARRDDWLVLTSDTAPYLALVVQAVHGDAPRTGLERGGGAGEPLASAVYDGDYTCSALAMSQADSDDQATADRLIAEAGKVNPVRGLRDVGAARWSRARRTRVRRRRPGAHQRRLPRAARAARPWPGRRLHRPVLASSRRRPTATSWCCA